MDDLCIICPGGHWKAVLESLIERYVHLGIREINCEVFAAPLGRDRLLRTKGPELALRRRQRFNHCLIIFDHDRCGDTRPPAEIERELDARLAADWGESARALVVAPSLEAWLLEAHRVFSRVRGLKGVDVRKWMSEAGLWDEKAGVPDDARGVVEQLFLGHGARPSAANYRVIADEAPIRMDVCQSETFRRMVLLLRSWFLP